MDDHDRAAALVIEAAELIGWPLESVPPVVAAELGEWAGAAVYAEGEGWAILIDPRTLAGPYEAAIRVALHELAHVAAGTVRHSLAFFLVAVEFQRRAGLRLDPNICRYDAHESTLFDAGEALAIYTRNASQASTIALHALAEWADGIARAESGSATLRYVAGLPLIPFRRLCEWLRKAVQTR